MPTLWISNFADSIWPDFTGCISHHIFYVGCWAAAPRSCSVHFCMLLRVEQQYNSGAPRVIGDGSYTPQVILHRGDRNEPILGLLTYFVWSGRTFWWEDRKSMTALNKIVLLMGTWWDLGDVFCFFGQRILLLPILSSALPFRYMYFSWFTKNWRAENKGIQSILLWGLNFNSFFFFSCLRLKVISITSSLLSFRCV